jgi:hypothetical protein
MGETDQSGEAEHGRAALDRMNSAKRCVQLFFDVRRCRQSRQMLLKLRQELVALLEEGRFELVDLLHGTGSRDDRWVNY